MKYRIERCPTCQLRPIEEYDLPADFETAGRAVVVCFRCGSRLWAILTSQTDGGVRTVVFRPRAEPAPDAK